MALDFGNMPNLFGHSGAIGDGMNPDSELRIREEASQTKFVFSAHGAVRSDAELELASHKFAKGDFFPNDVMDIYVEIQDDSGAPGDGVFSIRIEDNKGSADTSDFHTTAGSFSNVHMVVFQSPKTNTQMVGEWTHLDFNLITVGYVPFAMTEENVITTPFKISIRGKTNSGGTYYWKFWVYKRGYRGSL